MNVADGFSGASALVTGGAGFIGSHLVEELVRLGAEVTVVDSLRTGRLQNLCAVHPRIRLVVSKLHDALDTGQVIVGNYEHVFHLAANAYIPVSVESPALDFEANCYSSFRLLEAIRTAKERPRLVNISSAAVYGNPANLPIIETDVTVPISPYGAGKLAAERYVATYSEIYGMRAASLRLFSVFGPRQRKQVVYDLLDKLRRDPSRLAVFGDGTQERDFVFVTDVVQAILLAATSAAGTGEVYNVASGTTHSIRELISTWCQLLGIEPVIEYSGSVRPGDAEKWAVDISRLESIGFRAQVDLESGLRRIQEWYDASAGH